MTTTDRTATEVRRLLTLSTAFRDSQVVYAAAKLGIADLLRDGPASADELAGRVDAGGAWALRALLARLVHLEVLRREPDGRFALAPLGEPLVSDHPGNVRDGVIFNCEAHYPAWGELVGSVRTGTPGFELATGTRYWDYIADDAGTADLLYQAMWHSVGDWGRTVLELFDFTTVRHAVDVGGGYGGLTAALARAHQDLRLTLFDLPRVMDRAEEFLGAEGLLDRCTLVGGSFLDSVPTGADAYLLNRVLPDWDDAGAAAILRSCREAMSPDAVLLIIGRVVPDSDGHEVLMRSLNTFLMTGGHHRSGTELSALLGGAGLAVRDIRTGDGGISVVEAALPA